MKDWLKQKEIEQLSLFENFLNMSVETLKKFNYENETDISIQIIFNKGKWLDGSVEIEIINPAKKFPIKKRMHSIYDKNKDIQGDVELCKLMNTGLVTNNWFAVLDSSRAYNTTFLLTNKGYEFDEGSDACEYREKRFKETHFGFNMVIPEKSKKKTVS